MLQITCLSIERPRGHERAIGSPLAAGEVLCRLHATVSLLALLLPFCHASSVPFLSRRRVTDG
jgi:hypothetical protein